MHARGRLLSAATLLGFGRNVTVAARYRRRYPICPVMEGYSVEEAATVLGVPKGRVWELLARGVLAGTPEDGGGMRVFLRGPSVPAPVGDAPDARDTHAPGVGNGHGNGAHDDPAFEASPFRELLTEFRNLTERYGQALLALGEARGEVAGLRTRVELLEARLDLRLPGPSGWTPPLPSEPEEVPATVDLAAAPSDTPADEASEESDERPDPGLVAEASEVGDAPGEQSEPAEPVDVPATAPAAKATRRPRRRRRGSRSGVSGIAEALARAEDPTSASLPGGADTAEAIAALQHALDAGRGQLLIAVDGALHPPTPEGDQPTAPESVAPSTAVPAEELEPSWSPAETVREDEGSDMPVEPESVEASIGEAPELPPAEAPTEDAAAVYSSEWDEPDWIAEEDLEGGWGASGATAGAEPAESRMPETVIPEPPPPVVDDGVPASGAILGEEVVAEVAEALVETPMAEVPVAESAMPEAAVPEQIPDPDDAATVTQTVPEAATDAVVAEVGGPVAEPDVVSSPPLAPPPEALTGEARQIPEMEDWPPPPAEEIEAELEAPRPAGPAEPGAAPPAAELLLFEAPGDAGGADRPADATGEPALTPGATPASDAYEEELMWLGDEFRPSTTAWRGLGTPPATAEPPGEAGPSSAQTEELERLARLRGWDEAELAAIRSLLGDEPSARAEPPASEPTASFDADAVADGAPASVAVPGRTDSLSLPGAHELDEAMSALGVTEGAAEPGAAGASQPPVTEAVAPVADESPRAEEVQSGPVPGGEGPRADVTPDAAPPTVAAEGDEPAPEAPPAEAPSGPGSASVRQVPRVGPPRLADEDWLRSRRGPAANAYRRLRRYFPG